MDFVSQLVLCLSSRYPRQLSAALVLNELRDVCYLARVRTFTSESQTTGGPEPVRNPREPNPVSRYGYLKCLHRGFLSKYSHSFFNWNFLHGIFPLRYMYFTTTFLKDSMAFCHMVLHHLWFHFNVPVFVYSPPPYPSFE